MHHMLSLQVIYISILALLIFPKLLNYSYVKQHSSSPFLSIYVLIYLVSCHDI